ncbi:MAG TPA: hypothetical protein VEK08_16400 [Planctomycetota bacterium]|nr:hypothetical protein [Planctomycetota bacterium]
MIGSGMVERYIENVAREHFARRREKLGAISSAEAARERQAEIRTLCRELLGPTPAASALRIKPISSLERDGYFLESLTYESVPGALVTANLYLPEGRPKPHPGVLCIPGPWNEGKAHADLQRLGQLLARRGIAALLVDLPGQGERIEFYDSALRRSWLGKTPQDEQIHLGNPLLLTGHHLASWMLHDLARGLDVLIEHGGADPRRLGVTGALSGAGMARLLCCLDSRLSAAAIVADVLDAETLGGPGVEQTLIDSIPRGLTALDLLVPFAPKPLLVASVSLERGPGKLEGALNELRHWYGLLGRGDGVVSASSEAQPGYVKEIRARAMDHFARVFGLPEERVREPETPPEAAETLHCTETGQICNSLNAKSLFAFHNESVSALPPAQPVPRDSASAAQLQESIRATFRPYLRLPKASGDIGVQVESHSNDWGYSVEKGRLVLNEDLFIPFSFYSLRETPDSPGASRPAPTILALHERGVAGIYKQAPLMNMLAACGAHVMAIDVVGIGETRLQAPQETRMQPARNDTEFAYDSLLCGPEAVWAHRALNTGLSLFGLRVFSVLSTLDYLRTRPEVNAESISIVGVGRGGLWGLYAAALDTGIARLAVLRALATYKSLVEHRRHNHHFSLYLPGCLQEFDLPHVSACVAPRPLTLINSVNQRKNRCKYDTVRRDYALTSEVFKTTGAPGAFNIVHSDSPPETLEALKVALGFAEC